MLTHALRDSPLPAIWHAWYPALSALLLALAGRFAGKAMGNKLLTSLAAPLGVALGWCLLGGPGFAWDAKLPERLTVLSAIVLLAGLATAVKKIAPALPVFAALAGAWWLTGAPHSKSALLDSLPMLVVITAACALVILRLRHASPWTLLGSAVALWGGLAITQAKQPWPMMALALVAACVSLLSREAGGEAPHDDVGAASAIAFAAVVADLGAGKLSHAGFTATDAACFAPVITGLAAPILGRADIVVGSALAAAASVAAVWLTGLGLTYGF